MPIKIFNRQINDDSKRTVLIPTLTLEYLTQITLTLKYFVFDTNIYDIFK